MTLQRQLLILLSALLLVLLVGILALTINNSRHYFQQQLHTHAQDTATSLSLSLQSGLGGNDMALVDSMVDAIFDRGYYRDITIRGVEGDLVLSRHMDPPPHRVPVWFVNWLSLRPLPGVAEITHDWKIIGKLRVLSDTDGAYRELWTGARQAFSLFMAVGFVSWLILLVTLRKLFRPLSDLEQLALAICQKDFSTQQPLPKTRELRRVVQAMNRMTKQLKILFDEQVAQIEQVRNQAYVDSVSGLGNGRFFNAQLQARMHSPEEPFVGGLARMQVKGMLSFNERVGREAGNRLLKKVGKIWQKAMADVEGSCVARVSGARFAALLPHIEMDVAELIVEQALNDIRALEEVCQGGSGLGIYGGMSFCQVGEDARLMEAQADIALHKAQNTKGGKFEFFDEEVHGDPLSPKLAKVDNWEQFLTNVIDRKDVEFHYQPVLSCVDQSVMHYEALARVRVDGELLNAGIFIPLVERFDLEEAFDKVTVSELIKRLATQTVEQRVPIAINLSSHSIRNEAFVDWLIGRVTASSSIAPYLIFEVPELTVRTAHGKLKRLAEGLKAVGAKLSIDHFGTTNSSFGYLSGLPLYSIKVDHSYIRDIQDNLDHQFFVQSLVRIAHSRNILLTAEMVEQQVQWDLLRSFQLDGAQGYYLGEPRSPDLAA
ncbi:hypothetical protein A9Q99_15750 [Gammaproteobacteria bacterium 45_16_T64]|nr:hypothetical protein A9Q99_15750 [Gammaproteobacteria bacterium 45_16_T64]